MFVFIKNSITEQASIMKTTIMSLFSRDFCQSSISVWRFSTFLSEVI